MGSGLINPQRGPRAEPMVRGSEGGAGSVLAITCAEFSLKYLVFLNIFNVAVLNLHVNGGHDQKAVLSLDPPVSSVPLQLLNYTLLCVSYY